MQKTILVTGASGQLGQTFQGLKNKISKYNWVFCTREELDIANASEIKTIFSKYKPDYCINAAAYTNVRMAEQEKELAFKINAEGVGYLVNECNKQKVILFHISTDYVFDGQKKVPYLEHDQPNPLNVYGQSKRAGEQVVLEGSEHAYIIRTSWLYAKEHGQNFYRSILKKALTGESLQVVDDQIGTPTSTNELARFLLQLIQELPEKGIYHCGGKKTQSWYEFAKDILKDHQLSVPIQPIKTPKESLSRPSYSALATEKTLTP